MTTRKLATLIALSLVAAAGHADPVMDSFDRMLSHAATSTPIARPAEPADPLVAALVEPLRDGRSTAMAQVPGSADDPVRLSFVRMLTYTATPMPIARPAEPADPLVAALIEPLRDGHPRPTLYARATAAK